MKRFDNFNIVKSPRATVAPRAAVATRASDRAKTGIYATVAIRAPAATRVADLPRATGATRAAVATRLSIKKLAVLILGTLLLSVLASCEYITVDIQKLVVEKLDSAAVENVYINNLNKATGEVVKNDAGIQCVSSNDVSIGLQIRNPRNYNLGLRYVLDNGDVIFWNPDENAEADIGYATNKSGELKIVFSSGYLRERELSENRDISGKIIIYDVDKGRDFDPYPVKCRVNTVPPTPKDAMMQRNAAGTEYILCFYMPVVYAIDEIHYDTHILNINDKNYYFKSQDFDGKFYSDSDFTTEVSVCTTEPPAGLLPLKDDGDLFSVEGCDQTRYIPVYYYTEKKVTTATVNFNIIIKDDEGLCSDLISASNNEKTLEAPVVNITSDTEYIAGEDGYLEVPVTHSGMCLDNTSVNDDIQIRYQLFGDEDELIKDDTITLRKPGYSGTIRILTGNYSKIRIYAKKNGFTSSDYVDFNGIKIKQLANYYVSITGNDESLGTKEKPLRTISAAMQKFLTESEESECNIYLMSDIAPEDGAEVDPLELEMEDIDPFVRISNPDPDSNTDDRTFNIIGYGETRTIEAKNKYVAVFVEPFCNLNLKNIFIKGCILNYGTLSLEDCTVINPDEEFSGSIFNAGSLTLDGEIFIPAGENDLNIIALELSGEDYDIPAAITIGNNFTWKDDNDNATIIIEYCSVGMTILKGETERAFGHFKLFDGSYEIGADGKVRISPHVYVSSDGDDEEGFGTKVSPFATIDGALSHIKYLHYDGKMDFTIHVVGIVPGCAEISEETLKSEKVSSLTICGTSAENDILDAESQNAVLTISTPVPVTLENLTITGGYTTGNNDEHDNGSGIWMGPGTNVTLNDCKISNCNASGNGGGVYNYGGYLTLSGCTVEECSAGYGGGGIFNNGGNLTLIGCTIKSNTVGYGGGGIYVNGTLYISGSVVVTDNKDADKMLNNVYLEQGSVITVKGALTGSCIGVTTQNEPAAGSPVTFTSGYGYKDGFNSGVVPGTYFIGDRYGIAFDTATGEAVLALSGGGLTTHISDDVTITCDKKSVMVGFDLTFTVKDGTTDITDQVKDTMSFIVKSRGVAVGSSYAVQSETAKNKLALKKGLLPGVYDVTVTVEYNGMKYSPTYEVTVTALPDGFVAVTGATVSGAVSGSSVFIAGRTVKIPDMCVCDHEVTRTEYVAVMGTGSGEGTVNQVSWFDALKYCNKKSLADGLTPCYAVDGKTNPDEWSYAQPSSNFTGDHSDFIVGVITCNFDADGYRLPTEAEWEYTARGNDFMNASLNEWCWDYSARSTPTNNTPATGFLWDSSDNTGRYPVLRGVSSRINHWDPGYMSIYAGFRVVRTAP